MNLADINFSISVHMNGISLKWDKFSETARYVIVRKKMSIPTGLFDGTRIYIGTDISYDDYAVVNGEIYYYRLLILPNEDDNFTYLTDNKCVCRAIALNFDSMDIDYAQELYNTFPEDVKYRDATLKGQNEPLKRFVKVFAYVFNKLNTYADTIINQTDVDTCDEMYLPYHAKWQGRFYDARFGADINRLYLKTMEEAEPFIGTEAGLKYILQRVFKCGVEIEEKLYGSCFTNDIDGRLCGSLMTNGCMCYESIKLNFDDDNMWLSMDLVTSIKRIAIEYLPIRIGLEIVSSLISTDTYDTSRMSDDYLHDHIIENIDTEYDGVIDEEHKDKLMFIEDKNEIYLGLGNPQNYDGYKRPDFGIICGGMLISNGLMINAIRRGTNAEMGIEQCNITNSVGLICNWLKTCSMGYGANIDATDTKSLINGDKQLINNDFKTNALFYENSVDSYMDFIYEKLVDEYESQIVDISSDSVTDEIYDSYDSEIVADEVDKVAQIGDMTYELYKLNGNIRSYPEWQNRKFGLTNGLLISRNLFTNARCNLVAESREISRTNSVGLLNNGLCTDDMVIIDEYTDDKFQTISEDEYGNVDDSSPDVVLISDENDAIETFYIDESLDTQTYIDNEKSTIFDYGMVNDSHSLISGNFILNSGNLRNSDSDKSYINSVEAKTNSNALLNNMFLSACFGYHSKDIIADESLHEYDGVKLEYGEDTVFKNAIEALSMTNGIGNVSIDLYSASAGRKDDEMAGDYFDDYKTAFVKVRPDSLICSNVLISNGFYTSDISY